MQSLAICDFEVAAIRVTKFGTNKVFDNICKNAEFGFILYVISLYQAGNERLLFPIPSLRHLIEWRKTERKKSEVTPPKLANGTATNISSGQTPTKRPIFRPKQLPHPAQKK